MYGAGVLGRRRRDQWPFIAYGLMANSISRFPPSTTINLLNFNDFHGPYRQLLTVPFAATIEQLKGEYPDSHCCCPPATILRFCSTLRYKVNLQPTIDTLNALGVKVSAVGNHEFDQGYADLTDRVIGEGARNAQWGLPRCQRTRRAPQPWLCPSTAFRGERREGRHVGAVSQETSTLLLPVVSRTSNSGDPIEAVNRVG